MFFLLLLCLEISQTDIHSHAYFVHFHHLMNGKMIKEPQQYIQKDEMIFLPKGNMRFTKYVLLPSGVNVYRQLCTLLIAQL